MEKEKLYDEFIKCFSKIDLPLERFKNKTILITGATGLIGKMLVKGLAALNEDQNLNLKVLALVRNEYKAFDLLKDEVNLGVVKLLIADLCNNINIDEDVDYIIHGASMTQSSSFIEKPVEVIKTNVNGSFSLLELARTKNVKSMVYLSSMEAYGFTTEEKVLTEDNMQYLNPLELRSCYPESKRMVENMCVSYAHEYSVPVKVIRLAQTFGYGVEKNDTRVFAEFARCAINKTDINLLTLGDSKRMYLDTVDAVTAIITVLLKGEDGQVYNAANTDTYYSIKEMAEMVAKEIANGYIKVNVVNNRQNNSQFPPPHRLFLDVSKINSLGWSAQTGLREMFCRLIEKEK